MTPVGVADAGQNLKLDIFPDCLLGLKIPRQAAGKLELEGLGGHWNFGAEGPSVLIVCAPDAGGTQFEAMPVAFGQ